METRPWGRSGIDTAPIGFGTWPIGGTVVAEGYGGVDDDEAIAAINRAIDLGVTCFDTAPAYGRGRAEVILGRALGPRRQDVILVTKCGIPYDEATGAYGRNATHDHIIASAEESLRNLATDYLDVLLIHWPDVNTPAEETMRALNALRESGKVRHVGVSNFSNAQLTDCLQYGPLACNQVGYNLFDRRREAETFPFCREHGIGIMAYGPLAHGLLSGSFTRDTTFGARDWRASGKAFGLPIFAPDNLPANVAVADELKAFAAARGHTLAQLALAWVLRSPAVSVALVGARTPDEIETALPAASWQLSDDDAAAIERIMRGAAGNE